MLDPESIEAHGLGKGADQGQHLDDRGGVRRQLGDAYRGRKQWRRREVQCQRDILGERAAGVIQRMPADEGAERIA